MSGADECTSQEIEVSTSCSSTRNYKKYNFLQLILNNDKDEIHCNYDTRGITLGERLPRLAYIEKRDFIKNWILAHNNCDISPSKSCPTSPSIKSLAEKRPAASPIHEYQSKRFRQDTNNKEKENCKDLSSRKLHLYEHNTPLAMKENSGSHNYNDKYLKPEILKCLNGSQTKLNSIKSSDLNAKTTSPSKSSRICRRLSWINVDKNPITHRVETVIKCKDSHNLSCDASKLPDTSPSSVIVESEGIEVASSLTNGPEDETKIESDSDGTVGYIIETPESQNPDATISISNTYCITHSAKIEDSPPIVDEERIEHCQDTFYDSDETHYSNQDFNTRPAPRVPLSQKILQIASQLTSNSRDTKDSTTRSENISEVTSPPTNNSDPTANIQLFNTSTSNNKKKKKAKKGSLLARVQTLVSSQVSYLRIWRHQLSQPLFKSSSTQFVTLCIQTRETRYGRQFFTALVTDDSHNLLQGLSGFQNPSGQHIIGPTFKKQTITLITVPEITGVIKIRIGGTLRIYPPWEIMDQNKKILNITYFMVITKENSTNAFTSDVVKIGTNERIVKKFECPCITAKKMVDSCRVKFTNSKPNVIRQLLDS